MVWGGIGGVFCLREDFRRIMHKPIKYVEKGLTIAARGAWTVFDTFNQIKPNPGFTPNWSDKPLLKSKEKVKPPLGWPR